MTTARNKLFKYVCSMGDILRHECCTYVLNNDQCITYSKVKSSLEPSGPPSRSVSRFLHYEATGNRSISTPPGFDANLVSRALPFFMGARLDWTLVPSPLALKSPVLIYTTGWRVKLISRQSRSINFHF